MRFSIRQTHAQMSSTAAGLICQRSAATAAGLGFQPQTTPRARGRGGRVAVELDPADEQRHKLERLHKRLEVLQHAYINERAARQAYQRKFGETMSIEAPLVPEVDARTKAAAAAEQDSGDHSQFSTSSSLTTDFDTKNQQLADGSKGQPVMSSPQVIPQFSTMSTPNHQTRSVSTTTQPNRKMQRAPAKTNYEAARESWQHEMQKEALRRKRKEQVEAFARQISFFSQQVSITVWKLGTAASERIWQSKPGASSNAQVNHTNYPSL